VTHVMAMGASGVDSQIILGGSGFFGVGGEYLEQAMQLIRSILNFRMACPMPPLRGEGSNCCK